MTSSAAPGVIRLRIPCAGEQEFLRRYAPRYGAKGVFVPTQRLRPVGTRLQLRIEFSDGTVRVSGDALVTGHGLAGRTGMTLRFTRLHPGGIGFALAPAGEPALAAEPAGAFADRPQEASPELAAQLFGDADGLDELVMAKPLEVRTGKVKLRLKETGSPGDSAGVLEATPAPLAIGAAPGLALPARRSRRGLLLLLALAALAAVAATWYAANAAEPGHRGPVAGP